MKKYMNTENNEVIHIESGKCIAVANTFEQSHFICYMLNGISLKQFAEVNKDRAEFGFKNYDNVPLIYFTTAIAGEVGELCNMIAKQYRLATGGVDGGTSYTGAEVTNEMLAEELGGIFIYLDLIAGLLGINLEDAIVKTFNDKSLKHNFPQKI